MIEQLEKIEKRFNAITEQMASQEVLADPKPSVQFVAFGDSALKFKLLFWVDDHEQLGRPYDRPATLLRPLLQPLLAAWQQAPEAGSPADAINIRDRSCSSRPRSRGHRRGPRGSRLST